MSALQMPRKITTLESEDQKLIELFEKTECDDRVTLFWATLENRTTITPPEGTLAIVVDVRVKEGQSGAFFIHEQQSEEFVDMVGMENRGKLIIVPWDGDWCYYTVQYLRRVGYLRKKEGSKEEKNMESSP